MSHRPDTGQAGLLPSGAAAGLAVSGGPAGWQDSLAELGGFHQLLVPGVPSDLAGTAEGLPLAQALSPGLLGERLTLVRERLAAGSELPGDEVDPKVAASAVQVGLASRLWSPALAAALLHGWVPDLSPANLRLGTHGSPFGLLTDRGYAVTSPEETVAAVVATALPSVLALEEAVTTVGRTPRRVLRSNAASSLVGAARVLARSRPQTGDRVWQLVRLLLAVPEIAEGGAVRDPAELPAGVGGAMQRADETFLRSGCCVFYRLPGHGLCPDCVLAVKDPGGITPGH